MNRPERHDAGARDASSAGTVADTSSDAEVLLDASTGKTDAVGPGLDDGEVGVTRADASEVRSAIDGDSACVAEPKATTCERVACGVTTNNCAQAVDCGQGSCNAPSHCGVGNNANACVCDAVDPCDQISCGMVKTNGCGAEVTCGCTSPATCGSIVAGRCDFVPPDWALWDVSKPRDYKDLTDGTIQDNVTGLVWQKYESATLMTWNEAKGYCGNNTPGLPGTGWRLPQRIELLSIVDFGRVGPAIPAPFQGSKDGRALWTATRVVGYEAPSEYRWSQTAFEGLVRKQEAGENNAVRCVRSPSNVTADRRFVVHQSEVSDLWTGLVWQQEDSSVRLASGGDASASPEVYGLAEAKRYCSELQLNGKTWRLPTVLELASIIDTSRVFPALDPDIFHTLVRSANNGWTSTAFVLFEGSQWVVIDADGTSSPGSGNLVRCVR